MSCTAVAHTTGRRPCRHRLPQNASKLSTVPKDSRCATVEGCAATEAHNSVPRGVPLPEDSGSPLWAARPLWHIARCNTPPHCPRTVGAIVSRAAAVAHRSVPLGVPLSGDSGRRPGPHTHRRTVTRRLWACRRPGMARACVGTPD